ncbi:hypothetical protein FRC17_000185 [Serendipita sp. 399]|nr:hypothetical protein FRC17_000185 [Serendipita sp. 399]
MGAYPSAAMAALKRPKAPNEARVMIMGLNEAGKTTLLYKLKLGEIVTTIPTIGAFILSTVYTLETNSTTGFNVETIEHNGLSLTLWDVAGHIQLSMLNHYLQNVDGIILVIDSTISTSTPDFQEVKSYMDRRIANTLVNGCPLLVLANKQDLPTAVDVNVIIKELDLTSRRDIPWFIYPCSAIAGEGLNEGLSWMANTINRLRQVKAEINTAQ